MEENKDLLINIHSINCNIEIEPEEAITKKINLNLFYLILSPNINQISVTPIKDIIDGVDKENYEIKKCPLTINSYFVSDNSPLKLKIENKEENFLYFDASLYIDIFRIFYDVKDLSKLFILGKPVTML